MKIHTREFRSWLKSGAYVGLAVFFISAGLGCASTHRTTTTETAVTTEQYPANRGYIVGGQQGRVAVEKSETSVATTETASGHPGLISSTVHAIGWVIALPFRLIGGLIGWIF